MPPRYKSTETGGLLDTKTGKTIKLKEVEIVKSGRLQILNVLDELGKKHRIARYAIDEAAYNFGPCEQHKNQSRAARKKTALVAPPPPVRMARRLSNSVRARPYRSTRRSRRLPISRSERLSKT